MEPQPQRRPGELYRARARSRKHIHRRRLKFTFLIRLVLASVLILPMGWKLYDLSRHRPSMAPPPAKLDDRRALVAAVNKMLSQTGKKVPLMDLVLVTATLHSRDGQSYLIGAVQNRSSRVYSQVHIIFDTTDRHHNPAGVVEGDVSGVQAHKATPFEIGPVSPLARRWFVRSIGPVE